MAVTLMNVFQVPVEQEDDFLREWRRTTEVFRRRPGFIETHLHRNMGVGNQTFQFINVARWESADAWRQNHSDYTPSEYSLPGVKGHPAIFQTLINVYNEAVPEDQRDLHWIAATNTEVLSSSLKTSADFPQSDLG